MVGSHASREIGLLASYSLRKEKAMKGGCSRREMRDSGPGRGWISLFLCLICIIPDN